MIIRECQSSDREQLAVCMAELQNFERGLEPVLRHVGEKIADRYLTYLFEECDQKQGKIFVCESDALVVGFVCVWIEEDEPICESNMDRYAYISDLVVLERCRQLGFGNLLLEKVEEYAKRHQISLLKIAALARNTSAVDFYRKKGFRDYDLVLLKELD